LSSDRLPPELAVIDVVYVAATILFFAVMMLYVEGCDRLGRAADVERASEEGSR